MKALQCVWMLASGRFQLRFGGGLV